MTISKRKIRCKTCNKALQRYGKSIDGKQRWHCTNCNITILRQKKVTTIVARSLLYLWVLNGRKLHHLSEDFNVNIRTINRKIIKEIDQYIPPKRSVNLDITKPLLLDATWIISHEVVVLIAHDGEYVLDWMFVKSESYETWKEFLNEMNGIPLGIVSDGQKGLKKAVNERFGNILHQRCRAHVTRQARLWLTKFPKTDAGKKLLLIANEIDKIQTHASRDDWRDSFEKWQLKHATFLKEKSIGPSGKSWYTHRKIRAVRSLLLGVRLTLFNFLDHNLPATTNTLEGGINGPLKMFLKEHRGIVGKRRIQVTSIFLEARRDKNQL